MLNSEKATKIQERLMDRFPTEDVKQRWADKQQTRKLDYLSIDKVIGRMNTIFPLGYDWRIKDLRIMGEVNNSKVIVVGTLRIPLEDGTFLERDGIGGDSIDYDIDKSCKTAMAEAFKKACNTLGVALYLWNEDERLRIAQDRESIKAGTWTSGQLSNMKEIRTAFGLKNDDMLNKFIVEKFKNPAIKTKGDIRPANIDMFFDYAYAQPEMKGVKRLAS